jgi:hypothetical protein
MWMRIFSFSSVPARTRPNRTSTKAGGDQSGADLRAASYAANLRNQYVSRTVPGAVDISGSANANATVTVNNQPTYREGETAVRLTGIGSRGLARLTRLTPLRTRHRDAFKRKRCRSMVLTYFCWRRRMRHGSQVTSGISGRDLSPHESGDRRESIYKDDEDRQGSSESARQNGLASEFDCGL